MELLSLRSRVFSNTRTICVWLPPDYHNIVNRSRRNPVFYFVESRYRTSGDVGLAEASYGGAIVVYTAIEKPGRYKWSLIESPSLYISDDILLRSVEGFRCGSGTGGSRLLSG